MIELILDTNQNINKKNNEYIEPIIEMEKNTTKLISDFDDFSDILESSSNEVLSDEVPEFPISSEDESLEPSSTKITSKLEKVCARILSIHFLK